MKNAKIEVTELLIPFEVEVSATELRKGITKEGKSWERLKAITLHKRYEVDEKGEPKPVLVECEIDTEVELPKGKHKVGVMVSSYTDKTGKARTTLTIKKVLK